MAQNMIHFLPACRKRCAVGRTVTVAKHDFTVSILR